MRKRPAIYCRAYELGDLDRLVASAKVDHAVEDMIAACQVGAVGWTVTQGREVIGCAFIQMLARDHANLAALVDHDLDARAWAVITRFVRAKFLHLTAAGVTLISATVLTSRPEHRRYLEKFGFVEDPSFEEIPGYQTLTRSTA